VEEGELGEEVGGADELFGEIGAGFEDIEDVAGEFGIAVEEAEPAGEVEHFFKEVFEREGGAGGGAEGEEGSQARGLLVEEANEIGGLGGGFGGVVDGLLGVDDAFVDFVDLSEMKVEGFQETFGGDHATGFGGGHAAGDGFRLGGEGVGLAVVFELEAVFEVAEELVGAGEAAVFDGGEELFIVEAGEGEHGAAVADPGFAAAVEALETLDEEFDIADAAGGEFYVD
jgi:hypothetical protein